MPHTHWDREWYSSFQDFRLRLVETVDALLSLMEGDPSYAHFLLDGQMAAVDDYLEVRPGDAERIRALAANGRLGVGPWYTLMDEFLVSGETIVRDLQLGLRRAAAFGGGMDVGYLPDMFGHVAQMPQILRLAGFEHAVVWRGVPSAITRTAFVWESPDGSWVRAEYLPLGYGNGAVLPDDAKALVRRVADVLEEMGSFVVGDLLLMNGSDHLPPQPALGRVVAEANSLQGDLSFEIASLPDYLAGAPRDGLEHWRGELRSGARANMLMGVTSNRVDVKRAVAAAERALERRAEPYAALFQPARTWPERLFEIAWTEMERNAAHDSICACSVDDVVDAVLRRAAEARAIGDGIARRALGALGGSMAAAGPVVVNPSARPRSGMVELVVGDEQLAAGPHVQVVSERTALPGSLTLDARTVRTVLGMIQGPKLDDDAWIQEVRIAEDGTGIDVAVSIGPAERANLPIEEAKQDLANRIGARPDAPVRLHLAQPTIRRVAARVRDVPGYGWRGWAPAPLEHPVIVDEAAGGAVRIANGLTTVVVDPSDGTFSVDGAAGMGRIVDGGDLGDSYNYSPPSDDRLVDAPERVSVRVGGRGPVRATATVTAGYRWPDHVDEMSQQRVGEHDVDVVTSIELRADERAVRVATAFVNPSRDHRVRVHLPLASPATCSEAECAFGTVVRGLTVEGRPEERGVPTFPARRFVRAGGLTVVHDGVVEYELVGRGDGGGGGRGGSARSGDGGGSSAGVRPADELALTVSRSTGMLSRLGMAYRPFPAGPLTPVDGLQLVGRRVELRYALAFGDVDPWALADDVLLPLEVVTSWGGGLRPAEGSALRVSGAEVSAVRREAGVLEVRVFNPDDEPATVTWGDRSGWQVDLRGRPVEPFQGSFELRAHGIATVRLPGA